jgi:hypothetical protein
MNDDRRYNSTLAGKGAYLPETKKVLRQIDAGKSPDQVRQAVVEGDLLDQRTLKSRETYWQEVFRRYISERDPDHVADLARLVTRCRKTTAVDLVLFYEYCQVDDLLYDLTANCTYELYHNARTAIDKVDVNQWLRQQENDHPEIAEWSPQTRGRLTSGYLSTIRDFGLVTGAQKKEFYKFYVPREAFVYALYDQKDRSLRGKQLIESTDWRLFLMNEQEVIFMLEDAANGGFVHFRRAGDIYDLRFVYDDLSEAVDVIVG